MIFVVALIMGLPAIRGGFVGGDDHRLILNHVLVSRPSLDHAIQLFGIVHRDLYQPLPLLSFQAEFAIGHRFGWFDQGIEGGEWFFHLNNILLHAANAILVWFVVRMLHLGVLSKKSGDTTKDRLKTTQDQRSSSMIATIAALLFTVHPMQSEVVAWLNGRMMLMSTLFGLASLLAFHRWINLDPKTSAKWWRSSAGWAIITVLLVLFCTISKVRIGLPLLLGIVLLTQRRIWNRRGWFLLTICSVVVGIFVLVNIQATSDAKLFSSAAEYLKGPRIIRVLLALDHYIRHLIWPVGLSSFYPTPLEVFWSDRETWIASIVVLPVLLFWGLACIRYRIALCSILWVGGTIAATLPIVPARNILAADRYMYLPIIGLVWLIATMLVQAYSRWIAATQRPLLRFALWFIGGGLLMVMIGMCWHIESFYENPLRKTLRITQVFPEVPHVWERLGWAYHNLERYDEALECAQKELRQDNQNARSSAYQLIGMTALKRGEADQAITYLQKAIETDPKDSGGKYRLGLVYQELGQIEQAIIYYEQAIESAPGNNPTINRLAGLYRELQRLDVARNFYHRALENNPYDVDAIMGLVELDIFLQTPESYRNALSRLESMLKWMPDNIDAQVNLGVVYNSLNKPDQASAMYQSVLAIHPLHVTASMNLAQLYQSTGHTQQVSDLYRNAIQGGLQSQKQAMAIHDYYMKGGDVSSMLRLWELMKQQFPQSSWPQTFSVLANALSGNLQQTKEEYTALSEENLSQPTGQMVSVYIALIEKRYDDARLNVEMLCSAKEAGRDARQFLLNALETFDQQHSGVVWTYCLTTRLLIAQSNLEAARAFIQLCDRFCDDDTCRKYIQQLRQSIADQP